MINSYSSLNYVSAVSLATFATVLGCGLLPQGPITPVTFTVNGFTLSPQMVYSESNTAHSLIPTISRNQQMAKRFLDNLIMNAVIDVLNEQGRNALLPDAVIDLILQQLNITINYTPLNCKTASNDPANPQVPAGVGGMRIVMPEGCFIISDLVSSLCTMDNCVHSTATHVKPVPPEFMSFTGIIRSSNAIMASWSRQMWQSVLNAVHRKLISGLFRRYFTAAVVTV